MLADRGVAVDHVSLYRWVQRFAPKLEKRVRRHLRPCRGSTPAGICRVRSWRRWPSNATRSCPNAATC